MYGIPKWHNAHEKGENKDLHIQCILWHIDEIHDVMLHHHHDVMLHHHQELRTGRMFALLVLTLAVTSVCGVQFPKRFSATIVSDSTWDHIGCDGLPLVGKVYQDTTSTLWSHHIATQGGPWHFEEVLVTVPASTADPDTPEATHLTKFTWKSDTDFDGCAYQLYFETNRQLPEFFGYLTSKLETREAIQGIQCEKWSNGDKAGPYDPYWAVWYPINAHPAYSVVLKAQYVRPPSRPNQFPVPGCTLNYTFSDFSTAPIPSERFTPPEQWLTKCIDSDEGLKKSGLPDRQDGYVCVSPDKSNSFSIALATKPVKDVSIRLRPCVAADSCIDGARCKDCVHFSSTMLTFTPSNWSTPQTIGVKYLSDGDSQFIFDSPNYYLNNTYYTQFSTCACAGGKCTNNCQMFCG